MVGRALAAFRARLKELEAHIEYVDLSRRAFRSLSGYLDWSRLQQDRRVFADHQRLAAASGAVRGEDIGAAFFLQAFAAFEWFGRSTLEECARHYQSTTPSFDDLPDAVWRSNIYLSGRVLGDQPEAQRYKKVDVREYCLRLGSCYSDEGEYELNTAVFGMYLKSTDSNLLVRMYRRVGFDLRWDDVGDCRSIQRFFDSRGRRNTGKCVRDNLDELSALRHVIAHHGDGARTRELAIVKKDTEFLDLLAVRICDLLNEALAQRGGGS